MTLAQCVYFGVGTLLALALIPGWRRGRLRWYNVAIAIPLWPAVMVGGFLVARRLIREARGA